MRRFDREGYPGRRPERPTLVYLGQEWPVAMDGTVDAPVVAPEPAQGASILGSEQVCWVVAYGANASPDRVMDKLLDHRGALLLPARLHGWRTVWEHRRTTSTGAVPLTLVPDDGHVSDTWVLGIHPVDRDLLDGSEGRGSNYLLGRVGHVAVGGRWLLPEALAYGPAPTTTVLTQGGTPMAWPEFDQAEAGALLEVGATSGPAVPLPGRVNGDWPPTPLDDLDLFVYGSLKPGLPRWDDIAELVDVLDDATVDGRLRATFFGWPAAELDRGADGTVRGVLLRPRGPDAARELYARTDAIEDVPELFRRVAVRATRPDGVETWAAAYTWAKAGEAPGRLLEDGVWRGD